MVKKIMLWTVYVLIVGLLVFGAANRTLAKTDQGLLIGNPEEIISGRGQGNGSSVEYGEYEAAGHEEVLEQQDWVTLSGQIIAVGSELLRSKPALPEIWKLRGAHGVSPRNWVMFPGREMRSLCRGSMNMESSKYPLSMTLPLTKFSS